MYVDAVVVGSVPATLISTARSRRARTVTPVTVRSEPASRQVWLRVCCPLPRSLSVGARQKFGTGPEEISCAPPALYEVMAPVFLSTVTEKPLPLTVTDASPSSWLSAGTLSSGTGVTAGLPASTGSCCRATSKPALAHSVDSLVWNDSWRKYWHPAPGRRAASTAR